MFDHFMDGLGEQRDKNGQLNARKDGKKDIHGFWTVKKLYCKKN